MKKITIACLFILTGILCFAASEELEMYTYLYSNSRTHEDQLMLLQGMEEMKISGAGEFYANALARLVSDYPNIRSGTAEKFYAENQAILLAGLVGREKYADAADNLWKTVESFADPLVKAEALMSLGKIRAAQFLPRVIRVLNDLNQSPPRDRLNGERIAFGAIISLEKYGDISGYLPVYFASKGWYNERVKSQAIRSLQVISADPTEPMINLIKSAAYDYETKFAALQAINAADVSKESKSRTALAAFTEGWGSNSTDTRLRGILNSIRKLSMSMIRENGCSDNAVYGLLERSYKQFADRNDGERDEAIDAIITLRSLATVEAVDKLSAFLTTINDKLQYGTHTRKDEDLAREIIPAIGAAGQANGRRVLNTVNSLNWTPAVKRQAQEALEQLP